MWMEAAVGFVDHNPDTKCNSALGRAGYRGSVTPPARRKYSHSATPFHSSKESSTSTAPPGSSRTSLASTARLKLSISSKCLTLCCLLQGELHLTERVCPRDFLGELQYWGLSALHLEPCCAYTLQRASWLLPIVDHGVDQGTIFLRCSLY